MAVWFHPPVRPATHASACCCCKAPLVCSQCPPMPVHPSFPLTLPATPAGLFFPLPHGCCARLGRSVPLRDIVLCSEMGNACFALMNGHSLGIESVGESDSSNRQSALVSETAARGGRRDQGVVENGGVVVPRRARPPKKRPGGG